MSVIAVVSLKTQNHPYCFELTVVGPGWLGELIVVEEILIGSPLDHGVDGIGYDSVNLGYSPNSCA